MTPELAAKNAAHVLHSAAEAGLAPEYRAALVAVADGWTRLHTALANAPQAIEPAQVEHHWMLTYIVPQAGGFDFRQRSGLCQPAGRTRGEMFEALAQQVMDGDGLTSADFSVVFFGLEPNNLGAPIRSDLPAQANADAVELGRQNAEYIARSIS